MAFFSVASWPVAAGKQSATAFLQIDFTATVLLFGGHSQSKNSAREVELGQNGGLNPGPFSRWEFTHLRMRWSQPHIKKS